MRHAREHQSPTAADRLPVEDTGVLEKPALVPIVITHGFDGRLLGFGSTKLLRLHCPSHHFSSIELWARYRSGGCLALIDIVLRPPEYGWQDDQGALVVPSTGQIFREFAKRLNVFADKRNWLVFSSWMMLVLLSPFFILFFVKFFSWPLVAIGFVYSMVLMGSHGTVWYHRYSTHGAFTFRNAFWRILTQNLVVKMVSEEVYVVSHLVHHKKSDKPGDPYNAHGGFLYCFLADAVHQPIALDLTEKQYKGASAFMKRSGIATNTYAQYQRWGSISNPAALWATTLLNWAFWYTAFFLIGGHALAVTLFASALIWGVGVRTFNFEGHGKGKDRRVDGYDFSRRDMSVNQYWPGFVAGEWHNNHHLYASSARTGFLRHQIDFPFYYIYLLSLVGGVTKFTDSKQHFMTNHYLPYLEAKKAGTAVSGGPEAL